MFYKVKIIYYFFFLILLPFNLSLKAEVLDKIIINGNKRVSDETVILYGKIKIKDILLNLPYSETDRSKLCKLNELEIGKIQTIKVLVKKLNFPRIRNLPNKILCEDDTGVIDIIYFNSREGYLRKIFPVNEWILIINLKGLTPIEFRGWTLHG